MENQRDVLTKRKAHRRKPGGKRKKGKGDDHDLKSHSQDANNENSYGHLDGESATSAHGSQTFVASNSQSGSHHRDYDEGEPLRKRAFKVFSEGSERSQPQHQSQRKRATATQAHHPQHSHHLLHHQRRLQGARRLLRPAKVPKAPQNSTQFIIDDHENSAYFIDFEKGFTSPGARDDVGWSPYFEQDFENVYRTTREAEVIDWTHEVLVEKISSLEERVKTLEQQLSMCDPNVYLPSLQHRIVCMQDETRRIKEFRIWCPMHGKKVRMRHRSTSDESSDSGGSTSSEDKEEDTDSQDGVHGHRGSDNGYAEDGHEDEEEESDVEEEDEEESSDADVPEVAAQGNEDSLLKKVMAVNNTAPISAATTAVTDAASITTTTTVDTTDTVATATTSDIDMITQDGPDHEQNVDDQHSGTMENAMVKNSE